MERTKKFFKDEGGVTAIEYALVASLIAMAIVTSVAFLGANLGRLYNDVATKVVATLRL